MMTYSDVKIFLETDLNSLELSTLSFEDIIKKINITSFEKFLKNLHSPISEAELISQLFPDVKILQCSPYLLYRLHFIVFHLLFKFKLKFYYENIYLHISCLKILSLPYPTPNKCNFFDDFSLQFCNANITHYESPNHDITNDNMCYFHRNIVGKNQIDVLSPFYFYNNYKNFYLISEENAKLFLEGGLKLVKEYEQIVDAYNKLELLPFSSYEKVKAKFRELACKYHPDKNKGNSKKFIELLDAYNIILSLKFRF